MGEVENFSTLLIKLGRLLLSLVYIAAMIELEDEAPKILKGEKLDVDLSPLYWLMVKEIKERLRIFDNICSFVDDFSDTHNSLGKVLMKIESHHTTSTTHSNTQSQEQFIQQLHALFDCVHRTTLSVGVEHLNFSSTLSQIMSRQFKDLSKDIIRKINITSQTIQTLENTYDREKAAYKKKYTKYLKIAKKCESMLIDNSIKEDSAGGSDDKDKMYDKMSKLLTSNRDRVVEIERLCNDYRVIEKQLVTSAAQLNARKAEFHELLQEGVDECRDMEMARLKLLNDSLSSFIGTFGYLIQKFSKMNDSLTSQFSDIEADQHFVSLTGSAPLDEAYGSEFQKALETLESMRTFCQRLASYVTEIAESERTTAKASQKTLEKHGFSKTTSTTFGIARNSSIGKSPNLASLIVNESPLLSKGWESVVKSYGGISEGHFITSEVYQNKVLQAVESCNKKMQLSKKALMDKHALSNKSIDKAKQQSAKQSQNLVKVQKDISVLREEGEGMELSSIKNLGLQQLSTKMMSSRFGVAVGLESESDRTSRVAKQLDSLLSEEKSLMSSLAAATASEKAYKESLKDDVNTSLLAVQDTVTHEIGFLKSVLKKMVLWNVSALEPFQTALIDLKATAELIDIESDFKYFRDSVVAMADNEAQNEMVITLSDVTFEQLHITVIEEEMKRSPSYATEALHAVMSDGEDDGDEDVIPSKVPVQLSRTLDTTTTERVVTASAMRSPEKMKELTESIEPLKASEAIPVVPEQLQHSGGYELYVFGLNPADKVLETFNCALYPPSSGLMSQGRLFITQHYMAFAGFGGLGTWDSVRVLLSLKEIIHIEKAFTMGIFPTAIQIEDSSHEEYFFGSFLDRDSCYSMLTNMSQAEKQLAKLDGATVEKRNLVLGYQTERPEKAQKIAAKEPPLSPTKASRQSTEVISVEPAKEALNEVDEQPETEDDIVHPDDESPDDIETTIDIAEWFKKHGISMIHEEILSCSAKDVYQACWLHGSGFGDFLVNEGDVGLKYDEWTEHEAEPVEDASKTKYSFTRNFVFEHPRTTMLFIGPKNAPAKQVQHLYCGGNSPSLAQWRPRQVINTMVTKFQGFPFADTFKVVQYWTVTDAGDGKCRVRLGVKLFFIIQTMFRGQIIAGTESELVKQAKRWIAYCVDRVAIKRTAVKVAPSVSPQKDLSVPTTAAPAGEAKPVQGNAAAEFYGSMKRYAVVFLIGCFGAVLYIQYKFNQRMVFQMNDLNSKMDRVLAALKSHS